MTIEERIEDLMQSIESRDRQLGELTDKMTKTHEDIQGLTESVHKLVKVTNDDADSIKGLARIAAAHDKRISHLEG